jgi:hypothetical protein
MRLEGRQITCTCRAYPFPHRLNGGKCDGSKWAEKYFYQIRTECQYCNNNCETHCDVAQGRESIENCEGAIEELRSGIPVVFFF